VAADKARAAGNDDHNCNLRIMESETISDTNTSIISLHGVGFSHSPKVRLMDVIYPEFCRSVNASSRRDLEVWVICAGICPVLRIAMRGEFYQQLTNDLET
ncbi:hypothetical protein, partial [Pseudomonas aeruginosa]|uniref:hypothetical protein n=1 Tax=Pseudomonas aeruginosa TaxID=287 RepID=UPI0031B706F9